MQLVQDKTLLRRYIRKFNLQSMFTLNLEANASLVHYDADELICHAGGYVSSLLILVDGECMAYVINQAGKLHCELHYHGLHMLGLVSALWDQPVINDIKTLTPCMFVMLPLAQNREALCQDTKFLTYSVRYLADHIRKSSSHFDPLSTRLASFILEMEKDGVFSVNLTLCADILETSYRHLLRTLQDFCQEGMLEHEGRGTYRILDAEKLHSV